MLSNVFCIFLVGMNHPPLSPACRLQCSPLVTPMFTGVMCNPKQTPVTNGRPGDTLTEDSQDDSFSGGGFYAVYPKTNGRPGDTLAEDSQDDSFSGGGFDGVYPEASPGDTLAEDSQDESFSGGGLDLMLCTPKQVLVIPSQRIPRMIHSLGIHLKKRPSTLTKNARDDPLGAATRV